MTFAVQATAHSGVPDIVRAPVLAGAGAVLIGLVSGRPRRRRRRQAERTVQLTRLATDLQLLIDARKADALELTVLREGVHETARSSGLDRADEG
ncbi:hypothetical protein KDL01_22785 [Actinospica durhamensis]|uniref:Uncharacterized protein n=1 Tax=Actinospica durhamensis TaxID=1508375 RepID=A0A941ES89_9ACTN|nr:hypothetical protein [Actinospica durhamensis]MBR7836121.1 hypothetical protein [Actinospica durhamensis]